MLLPDILDKSTASDRHYQIQKFISDYLWIDETIDNVLGIHHLIISRRVILCDFRLIILYIQLAFIQKCKSKQL